MKKAALLLLLFFPGCLAATAPMGANNGSGGDGDKSAVADNFLAPPSATETPPLDVPGASPAPPPADAGNTPPPPTAPTPMMRSLPGGEGPAGDGSQAGDRMYAVASPGPIEPKTDQSAAQGLPCTTHHLRLGPSFSQVVACNGDTPVFSGEEPTISISFLLEKVQNDLDPTKVWVPETEGSLVRLVYTPAGKEGWEASYIEALTDATPDDGNVEFSGIPAASGSMYLTVFKDKVAGPPPSGWQTFSDKTAFEHFQTQEFFGVFIPVGSIKVMPQMTMEQKRLQLPPQAAPAERIRSMPLKSIYPPPP